MGRPSSKQPRDTRRALLDAALDLFAHHGFHGTSMRALASEIGVRESALYYYFPSKESLLGALLEDSVTAREKLLGDELGHAGDGTLEEVLERLCLRWAALMDDPRERKMLRLALLAAPLFAAEAEVPLGSLVDRPRRLLLRLFRDLRRSARLRDDVEFETFAAHLIAPMLIASNAIFGGSKPPLALPLRRFLRQHVAFLARALAPAQLRRGDRTPARRKARV